MKTMSISNRCSLCFALLSVYSTSTLRPFSNQRRHVARRCPISSIERLVLSSRKMQRLWDQNEPELMKNVLICERCCHAIQQLETIRTTMEELNQEREILINKIEHNLYKRALIVQARHQGTKIPLISISRHHHHHHQHMPLPEDEDTEEGEEKSPPSISHPITNGHEHHHLSTNSSMMTNTTTSTTTTTLVGAKRRKCSLAHRIHLEEKNVESSSSSLLNPEKRSNSPSNYSINKLTSGLLFGGHSPKLPRSTNFSTALNGHDLNSVAFNAACKSFALQNSFASCSPTPPFLDPKTGALIAIVSNPHHASLLSSSISPPTFNGSETNHSMKQSLSSSSSSIKKFPCLLCGRDFSNKSNLNRHHSIVHVAIRSFECARCPKKFKLRQGLKTHMQRCHGVNTDEPTLVLQKHHVHNYHHPTPSASLIAQTNK